MNQYRAPGIDKVVVHWIFLDFCPVYWQGNSLVSTSWWTIPTTYTDLVGPSVLFCLRGRVSVFLTGWYLVEWVGLISCCIYIPFVFDCRPILVFFEAFFNVFVFCVVIVSCICVTVGSIPRLGVLIRIKILKSWKMLRSLFTVCNLFSCVFLFLWCLSWYLLIVLEWCCLLRSVQNG